MKRVLVLALLTTALPVLAVAAPKMKKTAATPVVAPLTPPAAGGAASADSATASDVVYKDGQVAWQVTSLRTAASSPSGGAGSGCGWPKQGNDPNAHVDVDLVNGSVIDAPDRNVVRPNQGLTVRVRHLRGQTVTVQWGGVRGLTSSFATNDATVQSQSKIATPSLALSTLRFAPRQPGTADLTVAAAKPDAVTLTVELEVDTLYWGSVRVGLGTLFDVGNVWRGYSVGTFAGSNQAEIRQAHSTVGFELVSGFAPYLFDLITCPGGGRSYTGGCNRLFAPYLGFGLLGAGPAANLEALSSFHAGIELEFAKSFSVAITFVERRTQGLADGYQVGSPVSGGMTVQDVTGDAWKPGFGVIVNATPAFLQFATGAASTGATGHAASTSKDAPDAGANEVTRPPANAPPDRGTAPPGADAGASTDAASDGSGGAE